MRKEGRGTVKKNERALVKAVKIVKVTLKCISWICIETVYYGSTSFWFLDQLFPH